MTILTAIIFVPILAAIAMVGIGTPAKKTALAAAAINLLFAFVAWAQFDPAVAGYQLAGSFPILSKPELAFSVGADGITIILLLLTTIVTLCAVWMSPADKDDNKLFHVSSLLISAGALGAFLSTDLFFFYAFHELALIPTFLMIGIWGSGDNKRVAWKITIYLGLGSLVLLAGLLALFITSGSSSFSFDSLQTASQSISPEIQKWVFLPLLLGFGTLVSLFPLHSWAAPAYASAPTPTAMLHAGVLKKFGLYGLIRVAVPMLPEGAQAWTNLACILLLGNILYVGLVTIASRRLDHMLGNSSVMHMGYLFLGVFSLNTIGLNGAVLLMFAHGLSIALLFGLASKLRESTGTLEFGRLGGLGKSAPVLAFTFALGAFASIGLPGFTNFASEVLVFFGGFKDYVDLPIASKSLGALQITTILAVLGVLISAIYMLRAYRAVFQGDKPVPEEGDPEITAADLTFSQRIPVTILIAALIITGCLPFLLLRLLDSTTQLLAITP
ncbi:MAG: NADH-quinone oxidoreductase subunit M [Verrucomicrobiota bacterium]